MNEVLRWSASKQARQIQEGHLSARELCQAYLDRIATLDKEIGAYIRVDSAGALAQADRTDSLRAQKKKLGPLAGIPIGLKDALVTQGLVTTAGSRILEGWNPPYEGTAVQKLRSAGATILGKLNMDEFAMGSSTEHSAYSQCRNPWNFGHVPGGSSGGSAAAVAADLCSIALGTDTGGSIRQPAAFCGLLGIKPTYGRVSRYGQIAYASSLDQIGPMCRYAEDAALLLQVIAGADPKDATSANIAVPSFTAACKQGVKGLRIGIPKEMNSPNNLDPQIAAAVQAGIKVLENAGATLTSISLPHTKYSLAAYTLITTAEASSNLARYDGVRFGPRRAEEEGLETMYEKTRGLGFGDEAKRKILLGTYILRDGFYDAYYRKAQKVRTLIAHDFQAAFEHVDIIISPTTPSVAFAFGEKSTPLEMYQADIFTLSCNLAGLPGMNLCCGFNSDRLPIGMQLLAPPWQEERLFQCAGQFQQDTDWHTLRPPLETRP